MNWRFWKDLEGDNPLNFQSPKQEYTLKLSTATFNDLFGQCYHTFNDVYK